MIIFPARFCQQIESMKPGGAANNEGVLANFFNSLLHKKTGTPSPVAVKSEGNYQFLYSLYQVQLHSQFLVSSVFHAIQPLEKSALCGLALEAI